MLSDTMNRKIENLPAIISIKEIADFFSVSYKTSYRIVKKNSIQSYKDDEGNWCILRQDFKRFCSKNCNL